MDGGPAAGESVSQDGSELEAQGPEPEEPKEMVGQAFEPEAAPQEVDAGGAEPDCGESEAADPNTVAVVEGRDPEPTAGEPSEPEAGELVVLEPDGSEPDLLEAAVKEAAERGGRDRRQHARFIVGGRTKGRVTAIYDAQILDISPGGSLIEHTNVVRPGTLSSLDLDVLGKRMSLKCRVARSVVHRSEVQPDGDKELVYHTGLEFLDRTDETRKLIIDYIQAIIEDGHRPPPPSTEVQQDS